METNSILKALDSVEGKFSEFKTEQAVLSDRLLQIEQKGILRNDGTQHAGTTTGDLFVKAFAADKELFSKTKSMRFEVKAAADMVGTTSGRNIISGGVGTAGGAAFLGLQNAIPTRSAPGVSAVEYARYLAQEGSAGVQAGEGALKDAVRPTHSLITQTAATVAGWTKISTQALNDSAELKSAIDLTLARSVAGALNVLLSSGGTGFAGGYLALATAATSAVYTRLADAASEAVADLQVVGYTPDVLVMSPGTWLLLLTQQDTIGAYLSGDYLGSPPMTLRGLRVELSTGIPAGKCLVMDSAHSELLVNQDFTIELGFTGNDFTSNMVVIRGEMRVLPIMRSVGSMTLVTPKP